MPRSKIPNDEEGFNTSARRPWLKFYPENWRSDAGVTSCSPNARCLWIELVLLMHEAEPRGYLLLPGEETPPTADQLAPLVRMPAELVHTAFAELERKKVFSRNASGIPFSRKMVRETRVSVSQKAKADARWAIEDAKKNKTGKAPASQSGKAATPSRNDTLVPRDLDKDPVGGGGFGGNGIARKPGSITPRIRLAAKRIWDACPEIPRRRCGEVARVEFALRDAAARGEDPDEIAAALEDYYGADRQQRQDGQFAFSPNTGIGDGRWRGDAAPTLDDPGTPPENVVSLVGRLQANGKPEEFGEGAAIVYLGDVPLARPEGGSTHVRGTVEVPGPARQLEWLRAWQNGPASWRLEWGPTPGEEGCRIWVSMTQAWERDQAAQDEFFAKRRAEEKARLEARKGGKS